MLVAYGFGFLFPSTASRTAFQANECMKSLSLLFKTVTPSFKVDERLIWIEISSLPLCAWGFAAFKKVASIFGNFLFFENEQIIGICTGRVCVVTKCHQLISEKVIVKISRENFEVHVQEIRIWSINILDDSLDSQTSEDDNEDTKIDRHEDVNSVDDVDELINDLNDDKGQNDKLKEDNNEPFNNNLESQKVEGNNIQQPPSNKSSSHDLSRPPGFENFMKETSSNRNCSTSFANFRKKDIKGFSLINEINRIIEVGDSLGYDVRGCRKSLKKMINGIQESKMTKLELFRLKSMWGQWKNLDGGYFMINIYGPQDPSAKVILWNRIDDFMRQHNGAFVLFGDLNEVRYDYERLGSVFSQAEANTFNNFISNSSLIELPIGSQLFTWMNKEGTRLNKLDQFLLSDKVIEALPHAQVIALDRLWSDHNPILFHCKKSDYGLTPFRLFHSWFNREVFDDLISSEWNSFNQSLLFHDKLKGLKVKIKVWLGGIKSVERIHKEEVLTILKNLESKIDSNIASLDQSESGKLVSNGQEKAVFGLIDRSASHGIWARLLYLQIIFTRIAILPSDSIDIVLFDANSYLLKESCCVLSRSWLVKRCHQLDCHRSWIPVWPSIGLPDSGDKSMPHLVRSWQLLKRRKAISVYILLLLCGGFEDFAIASFLLSHPIKRSDIYDNIQSTTYALWLHHRGRMSCSWLDWLKSPLLVSSNDISWCFKLFSYGCLVFSVVLGLLEWHFFCIFFSPSLVWAGIKIISK
ncbi:RNA-directed DNA polymerase, eukaryota, reverse transcriptase zinc-binding domain protein [Tanacetum coccineum]